MRFLVFAMSVFPVMCCAATVGARNLISKRDHVFHVLAPLLCEFSQKSFIPRFPFTAAASDLSLGQSVRYVCNRYRCWWRPDHYYGYAPSYYAWYGYGPGWGHRRFWW